MVPLYASPSHGHGCVYFAFPRFCSAIMIDSALVVVYYICMSAVDEETLVSRHCDLTVPVTRCLGCSVSIYIVPNNCYWAPFLVFSHADTLQQRISPCVACISLSVWNLLLYLSLLQHGKFGRLATVCRRPGCEIRVTPRLHHISLTASP